jgi:cytochrome c5
MVRLALLGTLIAACAGTPPPLATGVDAERAHVALADLQQGRTFLVQKCGGCHHTPLPSEHFAAEWPKKLDEMSERARLDRNQRRAIEAYLVALAPR